MRVKVPFNLIEEKIRRAPFAPNMPDYVRARAEFSWDAARAQLAGLPGGGLNIAYEAVDRQADGGFADTVALRFLNRRGGVSELTYAELKRETDRFANVLDELGVRRGERVFVLAGRIPELYVAALGTLNQAWERVLTAVLNLRPGADRAAASSRRRASARDDRCPVPPEGRRSARAVAGAAARAARR
jgi:non-ribosomal peptide synthetase component F